MPDHIPPMLIEGNPFQIELPHELEISPAGERSVYDAANTEYRAVIKTTNEQYGEIELIHVVTEIDDPQPHKDRFEYQTFNLTANPGATLQLSVLPGHDANPALQLVTIKGNVSANGLHTMVLTSPIPISTKRTSPNAERSANYALGDNPNVPYWIRKWAIEQADGKLIPGGEAGSAGTLGFRFMVVFGHVDHDHENPGE